MHCTLLISLISFLPSLLLNLFHTLEKTYSDDFYCRISIKIALLHATQLHFKLLMTEITRKQDKKKKGSITQHDGVHGMFCEQGERSNTTKLVEIQ